MILQDVLKHHKDDDLKPSLLEFFRASKKRQPNVVKKRQLAVSVSVVQVTSNQQKTIVMSIYQFAHIINAYNQNLYN